MIDMPGIDDMNRDIEEWIEMLKGLSKKSYNNILFVHKQADYRAGPAMGAYILALESVLETVNVNQIIFAVTHITKPLDKNRILKYSKFLWVECLGKKVYPTKFIPVKCKGDYSDMKSVTPTLRKLLKENTI